MNSAYLHPASSYGSEMPPASTVRTATSSGTAQQNPSSLRTIGDDYYTPSRSDGTGNSPSSTTEAGGQSQTTSENSIESQISALFSALSSTQSGSSSQANSPLASALQTAEQDGAQAAQWMEEQAQMGGSSQATSPAAENLMFSGASLVNQFSSDLNQLGSVIGQAVSSISSSQIGVVSGLLKRSLASDAMSALGSSIDAQIGSAAGEGPVFGFTDSALSPGQGSAGGASQLSMYIAGDNAAGSTTGGTGTYGFALQFDSATSSAVVGEASTTAGSDGSVTSTAVVAASQVEQYTMYAAGETQTASGQTSLTTAIMNGAISNTVGLGVSETTDGSATSLSAVAIEAYSQTANLFMATTSFPANANGSTNAAPAFSYVA
jgi:hypothetical protein